MSRSVISSCAAAALTYARSGLPAVWGEASIEAQRVCSRELDLKAIVLPTELPPQPWWKPVFWVCEQKISFRGRALNLTKIFPWVVAFTSQPLFAPGRPFLATVNCPTPRDEDIQKKIRELIEKRIL